MSRSTLQCPLCLRSLSRCKCPTPKASVPAPCSPRVDGVTRLTFSIYAIIALHEVGEITEGQAVKLMNSDSIVAYRIERQKIVAEMKRILTPDMERHGWKWENSDYPSSGQGN